MRRFLSALILLSLISLPILANAQVPERRIVVTKDVDFYGSDLQALFDTTQNACEKACLDQPLCKAFTFNKRSNSCFPKSSVSDEQPYEGAVSARVLETDRAVIAIAKERVIDLAFLHANDLSQALTVATRIGAYHPGGKWKLDALLKAASDRRKTGDKLNAMRWTGAAVAQADSSDLWIEYARLNLELETGNSSQKTRYRRRALAAAINGYLRSTAKGEKVSALQIMAAALERSKRGREMIPALKFAFALQPRPDIAASLTSAIAKYGFNIVEHQVDNNASEPRICAEFNRALVKTDVDYTLFVKVPDQRLAVQASGKTICLEGAEHGARYEVVFREGLPAANGETLSKDVALTLYVKDRDPQVRFPGRSYVLPKSADAALPIETVNLTEVDLKLRRVSDRNLLRTIQQSYFGKPMSYYAERDFTNKIAEEIWTGKGEVESALNEDVMTRLPLGEMLASQPVGIYALTATIDGADPYDEPSATQWFVLTDLGITTLSGTDGVHVFVRGLGDAAAKAGTKVTLISNANRVLGETTTNAEGYAHFEAGLTRGTRGASPALLLVEEGEQDVAFVSLKDPAFDLSDRGVEGRAPAPPIDVFLATDRGAYRAGETIFATALARDHLASAIDDLPLTAILTRPDGVEYARHLSSDDAAGGHVFELPIGATAPRGVWRLQIKADPKETALVSRTVLVEDFLPERIDFEMSLPEAPISPTDSPTLTIDANYLFGAPAADLPIEGEVTLYAKRHLKGFPGFQFGRHNDRFNRRTQFLSGGRTDKTGSAKVTIKMPKVEAVQRPLEAKLVIRVSEGSGRPVERQMTRALAPAGAMIGIKPLFEDDIASEGSDAAFEVIAIGPDLKPRNMKVKWTLNRVNRRYQWYQRHGSWDWEPITNRKKIESGEASLGDGPLQIDAPVGWGNYELVVERLDGKFVAASYSFYAGWYAPADASATPDTLELSLDKPGYHSGDTAKLRIVPRYAGTALVSVMSNRLIAMKAVEVTEGENLIELDVTDEWGAGAYVTASVIRPMDVSAGQNPARSIGLSYAKIDAGVKSLAVKFDAPEQSAPRGPLVAGLMVEGITKGETAYVTVAAVDVGILNLTGFKSPDPSEHYFGQRRLGMDIRDVYGRLINGMNGALGNVRSGGGTAATQSLKSPPPTEELVAYFSGPVEVGVDGRAEVRFDIPEFNGTVKLMAVAWSKTAVGEAEADVLVRDPVVVTASLPRFLAPGDTSRLLLEIVHADGPAGRMGLDVTSEGITLDASGVPSGVTLAEKGKATLSLPLTAGAVGDHQLRVALTTPDGRQLTKVLNLSVRANDPEVAVTQRFSLASGKTFTFDSNVFDGLRAGTGSAIVSAGPLAKLDAPGLLSALNRYPYGCTEQVTSVAMPLLYFSKVSEALNIGNRANVQERVDQAIERVLSRQASNGAFGLWRPSSGDFWLDAYVSDFLSRARTEGFDVPDLAFRQAMDNLRNRINYAPDFEKGGGDLAYALMVLAREGAASMSDLRYYADVKGDAFTTPMAAAQLASALAAYGDQTRADAMFGRAAKMMAKRFTQEGQIWRADYGTNLRDAAGLLSLAVEAGSSVIDQEALADHIASANRRLSTQEAVWTLMAARALVDSPNISKLSVNGARLDGPLVEVMEQDALGAGLAIANDGDNDTDITLTTVGIPEVPGPASGYGYQIKRTYYTMDGFELTEMDPRTGDRFVTVLTILPAENGEARLMVNDPLPAGFEIDNPNLMRAGEIRGMDWLKPAHTRTAEFRSDRFIAAVDWRSNKPFTLAYVARAISPGSFHHPAASVEDMYRPQYRAQSGTGRMTITE